MKLVDRLDAVENDNIEQLLIDVLRDVKRFPRIVSWEMTDRGYKGILTSQGQKNSFEVTPENITTTPM